MGAQIGSSAVAARAHEELFAYWAGLRRTGKGLPSRADIHPSGFQRLLPTCSLIDVRSDGDYRLRLAGTDAEIDVAVAAVHRALGAVRGRKNQGSD